MTLKIIGGIYGSRVLKSVRGQGTRPLLGQVRQALFNILADAVPGALVWDLFAGSGATGIEALSHGAERVLFCEKDARALAVLKQNLRDLGPEAVERSLVLRTDAWDPPLMHRELFGLQRADADPEQASDAEVAPDLVFLDPPYPMVAEDPVKSMARAKRLLQRTAPGGCVVFHFGVGMLDDDDFDDEIEVDLREWGTTAIALLWRRGEAPERVARRRERAERQG